jgi:PTS system mannose-specific IID component
MIKDNLKIFCRTFLLQGFWNYGKLQNVGLLFITEPALKRLHSANPPMYKRSLARTLEAFNSNPVMSTYSIGAMLKQEEKIAVCPLAELHDEEREWRIIRSSTANTAASIGDRLFWATLKPLSLVLCFVILSAGEIHVLKEEMYRGEMLFSVLLAIGGSLLVYNIPAIAARYKGFLDSYNGTEDNFYGLINLNWNKVIAFLKTLGQIFTVFIIFFGLYIRFKDAMLDADFITRASLLVAFIVLSMFMKKLSIPNIFLYVIATVVFAAASFLA